MTQDGIRSDELADFQDLIRDEQVFENRRRRSRDPAARRRAGLVAGISSLAVLVLLAAYTVYALTAPVGIGTVAVQAPAVTLPAAAHIALPSTGAAVVSVAGGDEYLGAAASGVFAASGGDDPRPIASISKLITALVILQEKPLQGAGDPGPTITFGAADHALYDKYYVLGATIAPMSTGSSLSEHDALETMLVVSACNYAEALAIWAFGSESRFLSATADWLATHGMTQTRIVEPTGIDDRNTSSPSDVLALGHLALADPTIAQIARMPRLSVPNLPPMPNTNDLLGVDGVTGLKTGTLEPGGSNLLFSATLPFHGSSTLSVVGTVLGAASHATVNDEVSALLTSIQQGFHDLPLAEKGTVVGSYSTAWGASAPVVVRDRTRLFTWSDTAIASAVETTPPTGTASGAEVGRITWTAGPNTAAATLVLGSGVAPPTAWWRLTHPFELGR